MIDSITNNGKGITIHSLKPMTYLCPSSRQLKPNHPIKFNDNLVRIDGYSLV